MQTVAKITALNSFLKFCTAQQLEFSKGGGSWLLFSEMTFNYPQVLIVLFLLYPIIVCCQDQQTHYITPDYTASPYAGVPPPCFTLDGYLTQNTTKHFPSNTVIVFLPGYHYLSTSTHIIIRDVNNLVLRGKESQVYSPLGFEGILSHVVCTNVSGFFF